MTFIYYMSMVLLLICLGFISIAVIALLINPKDKSGKRISRGGVLAVGVVASVIITLILGGVMVATEPAKVKQSRLAKEAAERKALQLKAVKEKEAAEKARLKKLEESKPKVSSEVKKEAIQFGITEKKDGSIPRGERRTATAGVNGERTITYEVTRVKGKETARKEIKNEVTVQPVNEIVLIGTYIKPKPASSNSGSGYVNSQGNYVPSPSSNPTGATAKCRDGTYSYSQNRRGTCSHHGGVAQWL